MDYVSMGRRIRRARKSLGLTQNELANRLGITTSYLGHIELGKRKASMEIIINIANELRVSMDFLVCDSLKCYPYVANSLLTRQQKLVLREVVKILCDNIDVFMGGDD